MGGTRVKVVTIVKLFLLIDKVTFIVRIIVQFYVPGRECKSKSPKKTRTAGCLLLYRVVGNVSPRKISSFTFFREWD